MPKKLIIVLIEFSKLASVPVQYTIFRYLFSDQSQFLSSLTLKRTILLSLQILFFLSSRFLFLCQNIPSYSIAIFFEGIYISNSIPKCLSPLIASGNIFFM